MDLEACEEDCEGVFGGTALPGTACELAGAVGIYDFDCECILNVGCTADGGPISTQGPMAVCKEDGDLYLAKRDSDDLFKLIDGSFADIGSLPDGIYIYRLTKSDETMIGKFIISK